MIGSGRRLGCFLALAAALLLASAGAGCRSALADSTRASATPASTGPTPASVPKSFLQTAPGWRQATLDAAWQKALDDHVVALSRRVSLVPWALGGDGRTFFASLYSAEFSGVVRVDATTSRFTTVRRFPDAKNDQADGSFDGRWLVWHEYHSLSNPDDFTTWSWDSHSGRVQQIGAAVRSAGGQYWPSSWRQPDVRAGFATWTQGSGPNGLGDVHVVELASGRNRIVRHGHPEESFFVAGGIVVWPESMSRGAATEMRAADVRTGKPETPPPAFLKLRGAAAFGTDGTAIAFPYSNWTSLWWSPSSNIAPQRLFSSRPGHPIDNSVQAAGHYVSFGVAPHTYLADTATHDYIQISRGGWTRLDAKSLLLVRPVEEKTNHAVTDIVFIPLSSLPAMTVGP